MKKTKLSSAISLLGLLGSVYHAAAIGTAFTYQGRLVDAGSPASGFYDLRFSVWDSSSGPGLQVGGPVVLAPVSVSGGLFTVALDFGAGVFTCPDRWLQIESRVFGGGGGYNLITPRQKLTPSPYAITAGSVCATPGAVPDISLSGNVALLNRTPQTFTGTNNFSGNVGIGTDTPGARLDVRGDVKLGSTGQYFATGGAENLRIVRGIVTSSGGIYNGTGFAITKTGTGTYSITFSPAFGDTPSLTITPDTAASPATADCAGGTGTGYSTVSTWVGAAKADNGWNFVAIGAR